jgi:hypothetical protein
VRCQEIAASWRLHTFGFFEVSIQLCITLPFHGQYVRPISIYGRAK